METSEKVVGMILFLLRYLWDLNFLVRYMYYSIITIQYPIKTNCRLYRNNVLEENFAPLHTNVIEESSLKERSLSTHSTLFIISEQQIPVH